MSVLVRGFASLTPGYSPWPLRGHEISDHPKHGPLAPLSHVNSYAYP